MRVKAAFERFRGSLFFGPAVFVVAAAVLAQVLIAVDRRMDPATLPDVLRSTVDSARTMLGTIAGATITVAGVVFSVTVVSLQLASSEFSPRVLRGFFRDRFQQFVMGLVVGTFTYCLLALRSVRASGAVEGEGFVPGIAVAGALVLAVVSVLAILGFIDHGARLMQVGNLIDRIAGEAKQLVAALPSSDGPPSGGGDEPSEPPGLVIRAPRSGWVQQIDAERLLRALPPEGTARLEIRVGVFIADEIPMVSVWPEPDRPKTVQQHVREAIHLGRARTMQQDVAFGIRQLVDVGLRALSPGVNDPTTAHEVIVHVGDVLRPLLLRDVPPRVIADEEGRRVLRPRELSHSDLVGEAFDQLRVAGAAQPAVALSLLETLGMLLREVEGAGRTAGTEALRRQIDLVAAQSETASLLPADLDRIRQGRAAAYDSVP